MHYIALDGTKIKANTNREMLTMEKIVKRLATLEQQIETYPDLSG